MNTNYCQNRSILIGLMFILLANTGLLAFGDRPLYTSVAGNTGEQGERGTPGPPGPKGDTGEQGIPGRNATITSSGINSTTALGNSLRILGTAESVAHCSTNQTITGGGYRITSGFGIVVESCANKSSWVVTAINPFSNSTQTIGLLQAYATCSQIFVG